MRNLDLACHRLRSRSKRKSLYEVRIQVEKWEAMSTEVMRAMEHMNLRSWRRDLYILTYPKTTPFLELGGKKCSYIKIFSGGHINISPKVNHFSSIQNKVNREGGFQETLYNVYVKVHTGSIKCNIRCF